MLRRDFLKSGAMAGLGLSSDLWVPPHIQAQDATQRPVYSGWINDPEARRQWVRTQFKPYLTQQNG